MAKFKLSLILCAFLLKSAFSADEQLDLLQDAYNRSLEFYGREYMESINFYTPTYDATPIPDEEFDFIIVGAGPAGCALANRLSEVNSWKVLLLEAGGAAPALAEIPSLIVRGSVSTDLSWRYLLEKEPNYGLGLVDQRGSLVLGRGLGGGSLINYMVFTRGCKDDYNSWETLGNKGWGWKGVKKYFKKLEDSHINHDDSSQRGRSGPVACSPLSTKAMSTQVYVQACQEKGYKYVDYNGNEEIGVSFTQLTQKHGLRWSGEKAYLRKIKNRRNLKILPHSFVTHLVFSSTEPTKVVGVKYIRNGIEYKARAKKDVIASGGAYNSPKLLLLSGIGPKKHLDDIGVKVVKDLNVGGTLYDHLCFFGLIFELNRTITYDLKDITSPNLMDQLVGIGGGGLSTNMVEAITFFRSKEANKTEPSSYPDLELMQLPMGYTIDNGQIYRKLFRFTDDSYNKYWKPYEGKNIITMVPILLRPETRGSVKLRSTDPNDAPFVTYAHLSNKKDLNTMVAGIREILRISKADAFKKYGLKLTETRIPGCEQLKFDSDEYWQCGVRTFASSLQHHMSTCKMGPKDDPDAVVDNRLRVYGVDGLRVADCSVFPKPIAGHPQVPSYMVGEKLSDIIKNDYGVIKDDCDMH